jgi:hypothetical protein
VPGIVWVFAGQKTCQYYSGFSTDKAPLLMLNTFITSSAFKGDLFKVVKPLWKHVSQLVAGQAGYRFSISPHDVNIIISFVIEGWRTIHA